MWNISRPSGALLITIIVVLFVIALIGNSSSTLDTMINDHLMRYPSNKNAIHHTVIVKIPESDIEQSSLWWNHLLTQIQKGHPKLIAFNFIPVNAYKTIRSKSEKVIFSNRTHQHYFETEQNHLAYSGIDKSALILNTPFSIDQHIYRHGVASVVLNQQKHPTLTNVMSKLLTGKSIDERAFLYFNDVKKIPQIRAENVYNGNINQTLFNNRVVLLDIGRTIPEARIDTPLLQSVSLSQFQAIVIDTIINHTWIFKLQNTASILVMLVIFICSLIVFLQIRNSYCLVITTLMIITFIALQWLSIHYLKLLLPISSMIAIQIIALIIAMTYRQSYESKLLEKLAEESSSQKSIQLPNITGSINSAKAFDDITKLIHNLLPINQSVFMKRTPNGHKLQYAHFIQCTRNNIVEKRRNFLRSPYLEVSQFGKSMPLSTPFLQQHDDQNQYMVPLVFAHQLLGFWVYNLDRSIPSISEHLLSLFDRTANEIAENLYHQQYQTMAKTDAQRHHKLFLYHASSDQAYRVLKTTLTTREKHAQLTLNMIEKISSAAIAYDLMGHVMYANTTAEQLIGQSHIRLYETPVLTLLNELAGLSLQKARQHFQYATITGKATSIPITDLSFLNDYTISLKPLSAQQPNDDNCLFGLNGILIELTNLKTLNITNKLRENVLNQFIFNLNTRLSTMTMALRQLAENASHATLQTDLISVLQRQLSMSFNATSRIQQTLQKANADLAINVYPIDTLSIVTQCINKMTAELQIRDITITTDFPVKSTLALADYSRFREIIDSLLTMLAQNAAELTVITINMREYNQEDRFIEYQFKTTGFGMANGHLQAFMDNNKTTTSKTMQSIITATREIENWGGSLTLFSEFGEGISATLTLKGYCTHDHIIN